MAAAGAAPEIVVVADLLVGLVFLLAFLVLLGILWTYRHTFGWLLGLLANISVKIPIINRRVHPFFLAGDVNHAFTSVISAGAAKTQAMSGRFFHAAAVVQGWIVRELMEFAQEAWAWMNWLQRSHLPKWVKALIYAALPPLLLPRILKAIGHINVPALYHRLRNLEQTLLHRFWRAMVKYGAYAIPGAIAIPGLIKDVRGISQTLKAWRVYKRRLAWLLSFTSAGALVAVGLRTLKLGWLRCSNVNKAGRAVCGLPRHLLDDLLGVLADIWILENVCVLLPFLEQGASKIGAPLVAALTDATAGLCKGSIGTAKPLQGPKPVVPPVTYQALLVEA